MYNFTNYQNDNPFFANLGFGKLKVGNVPYCDAVRKVAHGVALPWPTYP